jgi:hypothetical protein
VKLLQRLATHQVCHTPERLRDSELNLYPFVHQAVEDFKGLRHSFCETRRVLALFVDVILQYLLADIVSRLDESGLTFPVLLLLLGLYIIQRVAESNEIFQNP